MSKYKIVVASTLYMTYEVEADTETEAFNTLDCIQPVAMNFGDRAVDSVICMEDES